MNVQALLAAFAFLPRLVRRMRARKDLCLMDVAELSREMESATIIDVRSPGEFEGSLGHIPTARNLPVGELAQRLPELDALRDQPIVLVCRTDRRSASAAALLKGAGFRKVRVLRGGMEQWNLRGLRVAKPA